MYSRVNTLYFVSEFSFLCRPNCVLRNDYLLIFDDRLVCLCSLSSLGFIFELLEDGISSAHDGAKRRHFVSTAIFLLTSEVCER